MKLTSTFSGLLAVLLSCSACLVKANTPLTDAFVNNDLVNHGGFEIAFASRPLWHFGKSMGNPPCYPNHAFNTAGQQHGVNPSDWPNASQGCPTLGSNGQGPPFPTYFTVSRCGSGNEIRVVYNLYYQKDGWANVIVAKGHMHDWERVIVIWRRDSDNLWRRKELLKSYHSGYMYDEWSKVQNTFNYENTGEQDGKDKDGAKIYVGWGKHAMFTTRNTGWNDPLSQGCSREFRSRDWWYLPERGDMIPAGANTDMGRKINSVNWGSATSNPVIVEARVCSETEGGYVACRFSDGGDDGLEGDESGREE